MSAQATQIEEENLIILDDVVSDDVSESSNEIKIEEPVSSENIIDFGNDSNDNSLNLGDFNIDDSKQDEIVKEKKEEVGVNSLMLEDSLDIDLGLGGNGFKDDGKIQDNSADLNSILDETIVKLQSRADIISENKIVEQKNIKGFKSQIFDLESNVSISESIVSELNKESTKIKSNIKSLEKMKLKDEIEEVKKEISAKVHNSKRTR